MNQETSKIRKKWIFPDEWLVVPHGLRYQYGVAGIAFFITGFAIWIYSGMAMFVLLFATSPVTARFESTDLDYSVWWGITALILARVIWVLGTIRPMTTKIFAKTLGFLWLYWVLMYVVMIVMVFKISSLMWFQFLVLGIIGISIWFFKKLRKLALKAK